jgi:hypothetical protein
MKETSKPVEKVSKATKQVADSTLDKKALRLQELQK